METLLLPGCDDTITLAAGLLRRGEVVAFPTETVYGLGADALNKEAVKKIFVAKGRPQDNPLIVHIYKTEQIGPLTRGEISDAAKKLMEKFWPGPMTLIFKKSQAVPDEVSAGLDTVGIRMPSHPVAKKLLMSADIPIAAPSANSSGRPSPTAAEHVLEDMNGRIRLIIDGGRCDIGLESTVIDMTGKIPRILRPGGITREQIMTVTGACDVDEHVMKPVDEGQKVASPGMKYRHYAPRGHLTIVTGDKAIEEIKRLYDSDTDSSCILADGSDIGAYGARRVECLGNSAEEFAANLFSALRQMDEMGIKHIFAKAVSYDGIGLAVMNRMGRAAGFDIINT